MSHPTLYSLIESPHHPRLGALYSRLGLHELQFTSVRKAISALKRTPPAWVVADFIYGYANNYSGVHISNLDVLLASLKKYAPDAQVIVLCDAGEREYAERLREQFPLHAILVFPVTEADLTALLTSE